MSRLRLFSLSLAVAGLVAFASVSNGQLITGLSSAAQHEFASGDANDRSSEQAINGSNLNFIGAPGEEDDPSKYTHTGGNTSFGQGPNWLGRDEPDRTDAGKLWFAVDLGGEYIVDTLNFFNFGVSTSANNTRGLQQADIYYSTESLGNNADNNGLPFDNTGWSIFGVAGEQMFSMGPTDGNELGPDTIDLGGITARFIAFDVNSTFPGGTAGQAGIGEVQFFGTLIPEPSTLLLIGLSGAAFCALRRK